MSIKVVGLGAGGHAKVVIEIIRLMDKYDIVALLDPESGLQGKKLSEITVLGDDSKLDELQDSGVTHFFIGLGSVGDSSTRKRLFEQATVAGMRPINVIHPGSEISVSAQIGEGATIMANVVINASAVIGINNIINTGAIVEHDCILGDHVHLATGAKLASTVTIGTGAHIGAGSTVRQLINIGEEAIIGAGATVVKDVPAGLTVVGNPAMPIKRSE